VSITYPQYPNSTFPNVLDSWTRRSDPNIGDITLINQYKAYILAGDITSAQNLIIANPSLKAKIFDSDSLNNLQDGLQSVEKFFKDNVEGYIDIKQTEFQGEIDKFNLIGNWSGVTQYYKKNLISYAGNVYMAKIDSLNHPPTTGDEFDIYWLLYSRKGDKGDTGVSIQYKGDYNPLTSYVIGDAVSYTNGIIYYCKSPTTGNNPSDSTYWVIADKVFASAIAPTNPISGMIWFDTVNIIIKYYNGTTWIATTVVTITDGTYTFTASDINTLSNQIVDLIEDVSSLNSSSALNLTSTQDSSSRTINITYTRSDASTYKTIDYSNFNSNDKPQTIVTKLYSLTSVLQTTNTATLVWSTDGSYVVSSSEVMS